MVTYNTSACGVGGVGGGLCLWHFAQGMNLDFDKKSDHVDYLCYDAHQALYVRQWVADLKGIKGNDSPLSRYSFP